MTSLTRLQWIAWIAASVLFGVISIFPAIAIRVDPTLGFQGIEMQGTDAEFHYAARVREVQDGLLSTANVFYADHKHQPYLQPPLPEWSVAFLGGVFQLDAPHALIVSELLFGAGVLFVMVGCFAALTGRFWWSLFGVATMLFAGYLFSGLSMLPRLLKDTAGHIEFLTFARPINPQWSGLLFFGALWSFVTWIRSSSRKALLMTGVLTGLSFYSYVYVWTFLGVVFFVTGVRYAMERDSSRIKALCYLALGITVSAAPYVWNVWQAAHHPAYAETAMRFGLISARNAVMGWYVLAFIAIAFLWKKQFKQTPWIIGVMAAAAVIVLNQQLITGKVIVSSHYHWYFIKPIVVILWTIFIGSWIWDRYGARILKRLHLAPMIAFFFVLMSGLGALYQLRSYEASLPFWREQQATAGTLAFLRENVSSRSIVYAQGFIRDLVPVYTSHDVTWATNAYGYLSTDERARNAYFFDLWMQGVSAEEAMTSFPTSRRAELSSRIHAIYYREAAGAYAAIPDEEVIRHVESYKIFLQKTPEQRLSTYPLELVIISQKDPQTSALAEIRQRSEQIYQDEWFEVRKVQQS